MAANSPISSNLHLPIEFKGRYLAFLESSYADPHSPLKKWLLDFEANFGCDNEEGRAPSLESIFRFINHPESISQDYLAAGLPVDEAAFPLGHPHRARVSWIVSMYAVICQSPAMLRPVINDLDRESRQFFLGGKCPREWLLAHKILRLFASTYRPHLTHKTDITDKSSPAKLPAGNLTAYDQTEKSRAMITREERNQANNQNPDPDIDDTTNKSSPLVSNDEDTDPESEYDPELDDACCDMCVYGLYPCRYSSDAEFFGLD
jgi:hypothetical protein